MATSLLQSSIFYFLKFEAKMGDNNKLVVVTFFFVRIVAKKVTTTVITFFKCFVAKKIMAC